MEFEVKCPILGFESMTSVKLEKVDDFFMKIKNSQGEIPSFTLINPYMLREYTFDIPLGVRTLLAIGEKGNILVLNIMVVHTPLQESTINFLAPLVFNFDNKTMGQVILESNRYPQYGLTESIAQYLQPQDAKAQA